MLKQHRHKIILNHFPRKSGKTHELVKELYRNIYKTKEKVFAHIYCLENNVDYLSGVFSTNLEYDISSKKTEEKDLVIYDCEKYQVSIGKYEKMLSLEKFNISLVLFDEIYEEDCKDLYYITSQYLYGTIFKVFYTSKSDKLIESEIFNTYLKNGITNLSCYDTEKYSEEYISNILSFIIFTIYDNFFYDIELNNKLTIDNYINILDFSIENNIKNIYEYEKIKDILSRNEAERTIRTFGSIVIDDFIREKTKLLSEKIELLYNEVIDK